jgi:hypothetical protein
MRQLKHHEHKLLKKVNFLAWKNEHNQRELQVTVVGQGSMKGLGGGGVRSPMNIWDRV